MTQFEHVYIYRFILIRRFRLELGLVVAVAMLLLLCGQRISSVAALQPKRIFKNGPEKLAQISRSFSLMELHIVRVEGR